LRVSAYRSLPHPKRNWTPHSVARKPKSMSIRSEIKNKPLQAIYRANTKSNRDQERGSTLKEESVSIREIRVPFQCDGAMPLCLRASVVLLCDVFVCDVLVSLCLRGCDVRWMV